MILLSVLFKTMLVATWRDIARPPKLGLGTWNHVGWFVMFGFSMHLDEWFDLDCLIISDNNKYSHYNCLEN